MSPLDALWHLQAQCILGNHELNLLRNWVAVKELKLSYYIGETHNGVKGLGFRV